MSRSQKLTIAVVATVGIACSVALAVVLINDSSETTKKLARPVQHHRKSLPPQPPPTQRPHHVATEAVRGQNSQVIKQLVVSPAPTVVDASPQSQISLLMLSPVDIKNFRVVGSKSGLHRGWFRSYVTAHGQSFLMKKAFKANERVTVSFVATADGTRQNVRYSFRTATPFNAAARAKSTSSPPTIKFRSRSARSDSNYRPPDIKILKRSAAVAPGYVFMAAYGRGQGRYGPTIIDNNGEPVWFGHVPFSFQPRDFKVQTYKGKPVLTWWQHNPGRPEIMILDSSYRTVAKVGAGNGLFANLHDSFITPRDSLLMPVYQTITRDLRPFGGSSRGAMIDALVQEIDIPTGLVMYEWHALEHIPVRDSYFAMNNWWDPYHLNSVQIAPDGSIVLSMRHMGAAYSFDPNTGRIKWTLGGKRSSISLSNEARFYWPHDVQWHPDNTVTVFDNHAGPNPKPTGLPRGEVFQLDPVARKATLLRQLRLPSKERSIYMGNMQALPNGNAFIGWGGLPYFSEHDPSGKMIFMGKLPTPLLSYRMTRAEWTGRPWYPPRIAATANSKTQGAVIYTSWNGATEVASWQLLAGPTKSTLKPYGPAIRRRGFETRLSASNAGPYFAVTALDKDGKSLKTSATVKASG